MATPEIVITFSFQFGLFAHPVYSISGDYPPEVRARVDNNSKAEGYQNSRLPYFTQEEVGYIRGQRSGYNTDGFSVFVICLIHRCNFGGRGGKRDNKCLSNIFYT
jgi:hypothetical protein